MSRTSLSFFLVALLLISSSGVPAFSQEKDILEDVKARRQLEAQRVETEVRKADREADRLARTDPTAAIRVLRGAMAMLEADRALTEARRVALKRRIQLSLRAYEGKAADQRGASGANAAHRHRIQAREQARQAELKKQADINSTMREIKALERVGRVLDAQRLASELRKRYPDNPTVRTGVNITRANQQLADIRDLHRQRAENLLKVDMSVLKSAANYTDSIKYPPAEEWKRLSKLRSPAAKLTAKERKILKALNETINVEFDNDKFSAVIEYFEKRLGETIIVHRAGLADVGITYDTAVKLRTPGRITMRSALKKILAEYGLAYVIKEETIQITSAARAKDMMSTRVYYVGDLFQFSPNPFNPFLGQAYAQRQILTILNLIQSTIDPQGWEANGGPGRIRFYAPTMSFIVRQSAEVHMMLGVGLR